MRPTALHTWEFPFHGQILTTEPFVVDVPTCAALLEVKALVLEPEILGCAFIGDRLTVRWIVEGRRREPLPAVLYAGKFGLAVPPIVLGPEQRMSLEFENHTMGSIASVVGLIRGRTSMGQRRRQGWEP